MYEKFMKYRGDNDQYIVEIMNFIFSFAGSSSESTSNETVAESPKKIG